jgi:hypothetical protein
LSLDHPKSYDYKFIEKPLEPEETPNFWRFKITLKPKTAINFNLKEQREISSSYYLWNWSKDDFMKKTSFYVKQKFIDADIETQLKVIAESVQHFNELKEKREKLYQERDMMTDEQNRLRENISVLGDDNQSVTLKERYIKKLNDQENRYETISSELETLDKEITKLNKTIDDQMNKLKA